MGKIHSRNSLNNIKNNKIIQVTNMLFMPEKTAKKMLKNHHEKWLKEKRKRDQKRWEEYLKNEKNNS